MHADRHHTDRRNSILRHLRSGAVRRQSDLVELLKLDGFEVTQSSVSRDIAALRLVKVDGAYQRPVRVAGPAASPDEVRIAEGALTIEPAGDALVVVHTPPGEANRVGVALDRLAWPDLLGTIAGDDTIFVAVRNRAAQQRMIRQLRRLADYHPRDSAGVSPGPANDDTAPR